MSEREKGELSGYAFGKHGADILLPGAAAKAIAKGTTAAKELGAICKNLQSEERMLVLEAAAEGGREMALLQQAEHLEGAVANTFEHFANNPAMRESYELFDKAQEFLKPYKGFMSESQARTLIHQTGVRTFPRPEGIPEGFRVQISDKGVGMKYMHPDHTHTIIRVMPGKPHSPFSYQQKPYVIQMKDGAFLDKYGKKVASGDVPEAHIPYEEFIFRD